MPKPTEPPPPRSGFHLDAVTGGLARLAQVFRPRVRNTLDAVHVYEGRSIEELFPAPKGLPAVRWNPRWRVPGMESEQLSFPSQHDPLEPAFRAHYHGRRRRIHTATARRLRLGLIVVEPQIMEEKAIVAGLVTSKAQKARWNNLIGVAVGDVDGGGNAAKCRKRLHLSSLPSARERR